MNVYALDNQRLDFKDSRAKLEGFLQQRCESFELTFLGFVPSVEAYSDLHGNSSSILIDSMSPYFDYSFIEWCIKKKVQGSVRSDGAIPGTGIVDLFISGSSKKARLINWDTQSQFNNQFNLYKYKRLKVFLALYEKYPRIAKLQVREFVKFLEQDEIFEFVSMYANHIAIEYLESCPHCSGPLRPIYRSSSQPLIGFIPASRSTYSICQNCQLGLLNPHPMHENDVACFYDDYDFEDFRASLNTPFNPTSARVDTVIQNLELKNYNKTLDIGGGFGKFSHYLKISNPDWDVTHSDFALKSEIDFLKASGVDCKELNFLNDAVGNEEYDLITMWEVVEHIPFNALKKSFENIVRGLKPGGKLILSTPDVESLGCKLFDFYNVAPPFHLTLLPKKWLEDFVLKNTNLKLVAVNPAYDLFDDWQGWTSYASQTSPNSIASIFELINRVVPNFNELVQSKGIGSEYIMVFEKQKTS